MTPSTTNTAAREVVDLFVEQMDMLVDDYVRYQEGDKNVPFVVVRDALVSALNEYDKARPHILTQQQGGEQEAGDVEQQAREFLAAQLPSGLAQTVRNGNIPYQWVSDALNAITAAIRSKQPAASEGDKYLDQLCHVVHALTGDEGEDDPLTVLERYAANGATLTYPDDANTSKQAAGEAVATVCLRGDTYAHGLFTELQVQHKEGVTFPIGTKFYLAPRHPADDGRDADSYYAEKAREQQDMIVLDKYADIARALGFPCDTWFGDPLASHEAIVSHATKLAALAGREAGEAASA